MNSPSPQAGGRGKLAALDGLRGVAATWVVFHHLDTNRLIDGGLLLAKGFRLVDVFFVLSGFVLAYQYRTRLNDAAQVKDFVRKRIARIWPLHAAILLALLLPRLVALVLHGPAGSDLFQPGGTHDLPGLLASLTFTHAMGLYDHAVWNGPSWTLSVEFFAYLTFAATTVLARGRTVGPALIIVAIAVAGLIAGGYGLEPPYRLYFVRCLVGFFAGVLAEAAYRRMIAGRGPAVPGARSASAWTAVEIAAFVATIGLMTVSGHSPVIFLFIAACFVLVLALALGRGGLTALLSTPPFQRMGDWSLGIYLLHVPMLNLLFAAAAPLRRFGLDFRAGTPWGWGEVAIYVAAIFVTAAVSFVVIERPARALIGRGRIDAGAGPVERAIIRLTKSPRERGA